MTGYVIRRLLAIPVILLAVYTLVFLMTRATPGGPWDLDVPAPPQVRENLRIKFHADEPIWVQYGVYLKQIVIERDFGPSYFTGRQVSEMIGQALPITIQLGVASMLLSVVIGVAVGILAAVRRNSIWDWGSMVMVFVGISLPPFVVVGGLVILFSITWRILPTSGWDGLLSATAIIPLVALVFGPAAGLARYTRGAVLDVLPEEFVRTAQAKGLRPRVVTVRHVLPNALIPVITVTGSYLSRVATGAFFVEAVFGIPGMGRLLVNSISARDYPVIFAVSLLVAIAIAITNLVVDLAYVRVDPRIRISG